MNWVAMRFMAIILLAAIVGSEIAVWLTERGVPDRVIMGLLFAGAIIAIGVLA